MPSSDPHVEDLVGCAVDFDVPRLELVRAQAFADRDVAEVADEWLMPAMVGLGRGGGAGESPWPVSTS